MILVTGANGPLGKALVKKLQAAGKQVRAVDSWSDSSEIETGSLLDKNFTQKICQKITTIYHLEDVHYISSEGRSSMKKQNVMATKILIEAAIQHEVKNFIFRSSADVYGLCKNKLIKETHKTSPFTEYGKDKLKAEKILKQYEEKISITIVRPSLTIGPGTGDNLFLWLMYKALRNEYKRILYQSLPSDNYFQLLDYEELATALFKFHEFNHPNLKIFNIGGNADYPQKDFFDVIKKSSTKEIHLHWQRPVLKYLKFILSKFLSIQHFSKDNYSFYFNNMRLDNSKIKQAIKWETKKSNLEIAQETIDWYKNNLLK